MREAVASPEVMSAFRQSINERVAEMVRAAQGKGPEFTVTGAAAETLIAQLRPQVVAHDGSRRGQLPFPPDDLRR